VLGFCVAASAEQARRIAAPYLLRRREDQPPEAFAALGTLAECQAAVERYVQAGASKFVLRPAVPQEGAEEQLDALAELQRAFA
jgi:alkanesulfonate monooxygenase SsuD/methylene tetrahydromethanopterin reductase-like flavin-dependent oxidoreductase (luciferase family)